MQPRRMSKTLLLGSCAALLATIAVAGAPVRSHASRDEKGEAALRQAFKTLHGAKSLTAKISGKTEVPGRVARTVTGTVLAMKPNFLRVELKGPTAQLYAADGKNYYSYTEARKTYTKEPLAAEPTEFLGQWEGEIDAFFGGEKVFPKSEITYVGSEKVGEVECEEVKVAAVQQGRPSMVYFIGKKDHLIHRSVMIFTGGDGRTTTMTNTLTEFRLDEPLKAEQFAFTPPAGARLFDPAAAANPVEESLVPVGSAAPRFVAPGPAGGEVSLSDGIKGKKALVINFWFHG